MGCRLMRRLSGYYTSRMRRKTNEKKERKGKLEGRKEGWIEGKMHEMKEENYKDYKG